MVEVIYIRVVDPEFMKVHQETPLEGVCGLGSTVDIPTTDTIGQRLLVHGSCRV